MLSCLIMRANPKENFSCFPGYETLALDTSLCERQVRTTIRELIATGLIRRVQRSGGFNTFYVNVQRLSELAQDTMDAVRSRLEFEASFLDSESDPYTRPGGYDAPSASTVEPSEGEAVPICETAEDIVSLLREEWGDHKLFKTESGIRKFTADAQSCIDQVGSPMRSPTCCI